jgi:hypothetical protein
LGWIRSDEKGEPWKNWGQGHPRWEAHGSGTLFGGLVRWMQVQCERGGCRRQIQTKALIKTVLGNQSARQSG